MGTRFVAMRLHLTPRTKRRLFLAGVFAIAVTIGLWSPWAGPPRATGFRALEELLNRPIASNPRVPGSRMPIYKPPPTVDLAMPRVAPDPSVSDRLPNRGPASTSYGR